MTRRYQTHPASALLARGEPMVWLAGGGLVVALLMVAGLVGFVFWQGLTTFWPGDVVRLAPADRPAVMGEITRQEVFLAAPDLLDTLEGRSLAAARAELAARDGRLNRKLVG